jgi:threonine synthase
VFIRPVKPSGIAKSLAIGNPADGNYALDEVRSSDGAVSSVSDAEIVEGIRMLARTEGVFAETAGGVTIGVLAKLAASGVVKPNEKVVAFITGNGLKTLDAVAPECQPTVTIAPNLEAFQSAVNVADWQ